MLLISFSIDNSGLEFIRQSRAYFKEIRNDGVIAVAHPIFAMKYEANDTEGIESAINMLENKGYQNVKAEPYSGL